MEIERIQSICLNDCIDCDSAIIKQQNEDKI